MNKLSKTKYLVLGLTLFLVLMPNMLLADNGALALSAIFAYSLAIVGGIMIGIVFAFIFNVIVELLGFSKPKHIILQVIFAVTFSGLYNYLEDEYNLLYDYQGSYEAYEIYKRIHMALLISAFVIGLLIGYLITPKKPKKTPDEKE